MFALGIVAVLPVCLVLASAEVMNVHIDGNTKLCNTSHMVNNDTVTIVSKGNIPGANCKLTFNTPGGKCGICFQFEKYAFFNSSMASLDVTAGSKTVMINSMKEFPMESMCSDSSKMIFTLMHESGYVYDANEPGYMFTLDVYNKCGYRGAATSVSFDDVKDKAKGYHHGEEKDNREQQTLITGLVTGLCLASIFLVVLLVAYCYVKNSPNRGASKSVGMPKGGKKGMDMGHVEEGKKPDVEMTAYKSKGADRPEDKPLLTGAAASVALVKEGKKKVKKERKGSKSSGSSVSSDDHGDHEAEEKKQLIEPTQETTEPTKETSEPSAPSGEESGYGGGSSDLTSGGGSSDYTSGGGSSNFTSGGGSSDYTSGGGGGYSGGFSDYSSGGGGGGGGSSCGGGGSSCGGGGGGSDD